MCTAEEPEHAWDDSLFAGWMRASLVPRHGALIDGTHTRHVVMQNSSRCCESREHFASGRRASTEAVRLQDVTREQWTARDGSTGLRVRCPPPATTAGSRRRT